MTEASRVKQVRVKPTPIETLDRELERVAHQGEVTILAHSTKTTPTESCVFLKSNKSPPKPYKESSDSDSIRRSQTGIYPASDTSSVRHSRKMQLESVPESSADEAERTMEETLLPRKGKAKRGSLDLSSASTDNSKLVVLLTPEENIHRKAFLMCKRAGLTSPRTTQRLYEAA